MPCDSEGDDRTFYFPPPTTLVSRNLYLFLSDYFKVVDLFFFSLHLADRSDHVSLIASKALIEGARDEGERRRYQENIDNPERAMAKFKGFAALNSKNLIVNTVDAFLWFVSAALTAAMRKKPEMVKSGETVKVEEIFEFNSKRELVEYLVDRKVNTLSYGGMSKIEKFISDTMGVTVFPDSESRNAMQVFVEVRNIQVHNRGVVNRIFLSRVSNSRSFSFVEGQRANLKFEELIDLSHVCVRTAIDLDEKICGKYKISRKRYETWQKGTAAKELGSIAPL